MLWHGATNHSTRRSRFRSSRPKSVVGPLSDSISNTEVVYNWLERIDAPERRDAFLAWLKAVVANPTDVPHRSLRRSGYRQWLYFADVPVADTRVTFLLSREFPALIIHIIDLNDESFAVNWPDNSGSASPENGEDPPARGGSSYLRILREPQEPARASGQTGEGADTSPRRRNATIPPMTAAAAATGIMTASGDSGTFAGTPDHGPVIA
jgi:hypothetical protein